MVIGAGAAGETVTPFIFGAIGLLEPVTVQGVGSFVYVCSIDAIPVDGQPVQVPVVIERLIDAWSRMPSIEVGRIWLKRDGERVIAWSATCPHLGCGIDWEEASEKFVCRCHDSYFDADGSVNTGPSPRAMDELEVRLVGREVEVKFKRFVIGAVEKKSL